MKVEGQYSCPYVYRGTERELQLFAPSVPVVKLDCSRTAAPPAFTSGNGGSFLTRHVSTRHSTSIFVTSVPRAPTRANVRNAYSREAILKELTRLILGVCGASAQVLAGISARRRQGCAAPEAAGSNWFWPSPLQGAAELTAGAARAAVENTAQLRGARIKRCEE